MKNEKIITTLGAVALSIVTGYVIWLKVTTNSKRKVAKEIKKLGPGKAGLAYYNYAAAGAKKKGLIEEDAKISSLDEIKGLNKDQLNAVEIVLGLITAGEVSIGPARDERGVFVKTEKEGE